VSGKSANGPGIKFTRNWKRGISWCRLCPSIPRVLLQMIVYMALMILLISDNQEPLNV